jgi:hypothetical protein
LLFAEDLHHGFVLGLVDLGEGLGDEGAVVEAAVVEHLIEAEGGVAEEDLGVFEALVVVCHGEVDFVGEALDLLEEAGGLVTVSGGILMEAELGHFVE